MAVNSSSNASSSYPHPWIAKEGWPILFVSALIAVLVSMFSEGWAVLPWLWTLFALQFFRDPPRIIPNAPNIVVSPADGCVVAVETTQDPYAQREAIKISVFMNVFNVHSNRAPVDGEILSQTYVPGRFLNADLDKASLENERNALVIQTPQGQVVTSVQIAGLIARRILCYVAKGDMLQRGQRYGFIRFGSRVDVYLPLTATPRVSIGDKVAATETILADL